MRVFAGPDLIAPLSDRWPRDALPSCNCLSSPPESASHCRARSAPPTPCCWHASRSSAAAGSSTAIFTAEPADTQRLEDELSFFAPELRVAVFPDWETLPYDTFSPHQDLISERLATLWRCIRAEREVDVVLMPASTALMRLAPPCFLAATPSTSSRSSGSTRPR